MRVIRRLVMLAIIGAGGVAAYNYWSEAGWPVRPRGAALEAQTLKKQATRLANQAANTAGGAAVVLGDSMSEGALTAKIKSKMALDDRVSARAIDVDTSGSAVTLTGVVGSVEERRRAVGLARETEGVSQVIDRLQVR